MTFEKAFDSIKRKFADADAKNVSDFALQITLSDEDCGGTFYVAVKDGVLSVEPYDYKDNDAVIDISKSDLLAVIAGRKSFDKAVENGASLKGDISVTDSLKAVLKTAKLAKKETVKKETAKKETAKKETVKEEPAKKETAAKEKKTVAKRTAKTSRKRTK